MGGARHRPHDGVRDVLGRQRLGDALVDLVGGGLGAQAVERELLGADHPGGDLDDADGLADQFLAQRVRDDALGVLGGDVAPAARIGVVGGRRGEEHDVSPALAQAGQEGAGHLEGRDDVAVEHRRPALRVGVRDRVRAQGPARHVDDGVDRTQAQDVAGHRGDLLVVDQVGGKVRAVGLLRQLLQPHHAPGDGRDGPAPLAQEAHRGLPDPRRGPRHHCPAHAPGLHVPIMEPPPGGGEPFSARRAEPMPPPAAGGRTRRCPGSSRCRRRNTHGRG